MKGESLKCCSIYSACSTTQGVKHLRSDIVCIHIHKGTHTHTEIWILAHLMYAPGPVHTHTQQQPSCAADLKQLPSQALSTLGSGELTAARGQALMLPPPPFLTHWADLLANQVWLSPTIYHAPCQKSYRAEYLKKSANPRLSGDPRIVIHNNSCTILCHSISLLFHIGST